MVGWEIWSYAHVPLVWYLFKKFGKRDVSGSLVAGSVIGCFLEFATQPLWTYHFRFTIYKDVAPSIVLGWGVVFTLVVTFSDALYRRVLHRRRVQMDDRRLFLFDVIAACLIAFPMEAVGVKAGVWTYNQEILQWHWGQVPLLHMPWEALVSYALLMLVAPTFVRRWQGPLSFAHRSKR